MNDEPEPRRSAPIAVSEPFEPGPDPVAQWLDWEAQGVAFVHTAKHRHPSGRTAAPVERHGHCTPRLTAWSRRRTVIRRHFHRCGHLRVIELDASDLSQARKGSSQILEELCEAKHLAPCVGLAECDVLAPGQKRELLVTRATHLRGEEGGISPLADARAGDPRATELAELRDTLLAERNAIAQENRRRAAEAGGALHRNPRPVGRAEEGDLRSAGISVVLDDELRALRAARLDAIDRALDAIGRGHYGSCVRCGAPIEFARLEETPDTVLCTPCARGFLGRGR